MPFMGMSFMGISFFVIIGLIGILTLVVFLAMCYTSYFLSFLLSYCYLVVYYILYNWVSRGCVYMPTPRVQRVGAFSLGGVRPAASTAHDLQNTPAAISLFCRTARAVDAVLPVEFVCCFSNIEQNKYFVAILHSSKT
jgi:energy-coupling factor transporter transmembrane protein EcfT